MVFTRDYFAWKYFFALFWALYWDKLTDYPHQHLKIETINERWKLKQLTNERFERTTKDIFTIYRNCPWMGLQRNFHNLQKNALSKCSWPFFSYYKNCITLVSYCVQDDKESVIISIYLFFICIFSSYANNTFLAKKEGKNPEMKNVE